jgi:hypothetical protein
VELSGRAVTLFWYQAPERYIMMNGFSQTDVFTLALGLTEPWRVTDVEMVSSEKNPEKLEVHITVDYQEGSKFPCPECAESCNKIPISVYYYEALS